jgi:hypothetical protein
MRGRRGEVGLWVGVDTGDVGCTLGDARGAGPSGTEPPIGARLQVMSARSSRHM